MSILDSRLFRPLATLLSLGVAIAATACASDAPSPASPQRIAPKPLFTDPNYNGSCDPEIVWNTHAQEWWVFYTARRSTITDSYVGTPIGVIASKDLITWRFLGYASFDGAPGKADMPVTYWAPGIIRAGDTYHMFVTYKDNATPPWGGAGVIRHYTAPASDLLNGWKLSTVPQFPKPDPIDATLIKIGDEYRAYYRVGGGNDVGSRIEWSSSPDLHTWKNHGKCPGDVTAPPAKRGFAYQEAPFVFQYQGSYWMITDPHKGLAIYKSADGVEWTLQSDRILKEPGKGAQDATLARHPSVAVIGERAFLIYHTEPNRPYPTPPPEKRTAEMKIAFIQIAELKVIDGKLTCDRDQLVVPPTDVAP